MDDIKKNLKHLTKKEKGRNILFLSSFFKNWTEEYKNKMVEIHLILYETFFEESRYFNPCVTSFDSDEHGEITTFNFRQWNGYFNAKAITLEELDELLKHYLYYNEKYLEIRLYLEILISESKEQVTDLQKFYLEFFYKVRGWDEMKYEEIKRLYDKFSYVYFRSSYTINSETYSQRKKRDLDFNINMHDFYRSYRHTGFLTMEIHPDELVDQKKCVSLNN